MKSNLATVEFNDDKIERVLSVNKKAVCAEAVLVCYSVGKDIGSTRLYVCNGDFQNTYACQFRIFGNYSVNTENSFGMRLSKTDAIIDGINELEGILATNGGKIDEICLDEKE